MSSPTQGAWECRHGVDSRDECDDCYAPFENFPGPGDSEGGDVFSPLGVYIDPFIDTCIHGVKGARVNREGSRNSPTCLVCNPPEEQENDDYHDSTYQSRDLSSSGDRTPEWYRKWIY
jgi:hypothetical protein